MLDFLRRSLEAADRDQEGALNTQFVLLAGVGAVIAIALGVILYQNVTDAADSIDMDFNQIGTALQPLLSLF